ncbi:hypothetical protein BG004_003710, partial [Podila humilis]
MSVLSRIPGLASLGTLVASAFSLHHPTIRRYNDILANAFYHHGRMCATNQATVMVLVIIFVGIISYPGIVTTYNSSSYARSPLTSTLPTLTFANRRGVANLESFWADVIAPTWTQDTDLIDSQVSSQVPPLHFIAPVIINASSIILQQQQTNQKHQGYQPGVEKEEAAAAVIFSETDLLIFASQVQQRIETIEVDYNAPEHPQASLDWTPRYLTLRDICVLDNESAKIPKPCLVQSPLVHWTHPEDPLAPDMDALDHILKLQNSSIASVKSSLFGRIARDFKSAGDATTKGVVERGGEDAGSLMLTGGAGGENGVGGVDYSSSSSSVVGTDQEQLQEEQQPNATASSLAITFFLRGDLSSDGSVDPKQQQDHISSSSGPLNVERAWKLIFGRMLEEWQERPQAKKGSQDDDNTWPPSSLVTATGETDFFPGDVNGREDKASQEQQPRQEVPDARINHSPTSLTTTSPLPKNEKQEGQQQNQQRKLLSHPRFAGLIIDTTVSDIGKPYAGSRRLVSE